MPSLTKESSTNGPATTKNLFHATRLPGWAGIEEHFMKYDSSVMKDFADDIDTLLVFAALFSAILTTFVVQTYQLLQLSDSFFTN
ncbi:hypothetical protein PHLGIDRAFT_185490 [Phlebiopsis gigantea 11061_1 CR5-6]|uniref:DUF6535 domain-containing protein n=1 Tax=Phlebiopsis gigantea (strain 11061_1 CR5-6) TaxID=745531 RepID=A0A0C3SCG2_PHLG1|nr:hypothetical protein PHLGIDRAFT_185490 [Phlebiopsis gigantea 11061_1 CR5-6]